MRSAPDSGLTDTATGVPGLPVLDAADADFGADPHPVYDALRSTGPVRQIGLTNGSTGWIVTSFDAARAALAHPHLSNQLRPGSAATGARSVLERHMLTTDAPDHTRLRHLVGRAFSARRMGLLTPAIHRITDDLVAGLRATGPAPVDFMTEFAFPLPVAVIFEVLGVPLADRDDLRSWTYVVASPAAVVGESENAWKFMLDYFAELIASKRAHPTDDLFSELVVAEDESGQMSEQELLAMAFLLLFAGYETTMNLLGSMALSLTTDASLRRSLRSDPTLADGAIEELLRHASPIEGAFWRRATKDVELAGVRIPAGDTVLVSLAAANRDPDRFGAPHVIDVTRPGPAHVAFGYGAHYCVGAHLARLEARIALRALLDDLSDLALAVDPADVPWRPGLLVRGPARLMVSVGPAPAAALLRRCDHDTPTEPVHDQVT